MVGVINRSHWEVRLYFVEKFYSRPALPNEVTPPLDPFS